MSHRRPVSLTSSKDGGEVGVVESEEGGVMLPYEVPCLFQGPEPGGLAWFVMSCCGDCFGVVLCCCGVVCGVVFWWLL